MFHGPCRSMLVGHQRPASRRHSPKLSKLPGIAGARASKYSTKVNDTCPPHDTRLDEQLPTLYLPFLTHNWNLCNGWNTKRPRSTFVSPTMSAVEAEKPAPAGGPEAEERKMAIDAEIQTAEPNGAINIGDGTMVEDEGSKYEDKKPLMITTQFATLLPSPLPSPTRDDSETSASVSASFSNGNVQSRPPSSFFDTASEGIGGFYSSNGLVSCAVSEADTDVPTSAVESSNETLPFSSENHTTPKKQPRRSSVSARRTRERSGTKSSDHSSVRRLSASKIQELTASPDSLPVASLVEQPLSAGFAETSNRASLIAHHNSPIPHRIYDRIENQRLEAFGDTPSGRTLHSERPVLSTRPLSTPGHHRKSGSQPSGPPSSTRRNSFQPSTRPGPLSLEGGSNFGSHSKPHNPDHHSRHESKETRDSREPRAPSPISLSFPIPPLSAPTFLQLELAAQRPSPLYVYQTYSSDIPYESSAVKFERLKNFLFLPPLLERTLVIGALACLDAWLWTLTILPMRFCLALKVLVGWWGYLIVKEAKWMIGFVWEGLGRMWERTRRGPNLSRRPSYASSRSTDGPSRSPSRVREPLKESIANVSSTSHTGPANEPARRPDTARMRTGTNGFPLPPPSRARSRRGPFHHKRTKSQPSDLSSFHKADLLQFAVIIVSSLILTQLDASRMYHFIRAQSAVKLYVIYNLVEVSHADPT